MEKKQPENKSYKRDGGFGIVPAAIVAILLNIFLPKDNDTAKQEG